MSSTKKAVSFTIRADLIEWLSQKAQASSSNRSQLVEKALESLRRDEIFDRLKESFQRMKNDDEMVDLAEMGMSDFLEMYDD